MLGVRASGIHQSQIFLKFVAVIISIFCLYVLCNFSAASELFIRDETNERGSEARLKSVQKTCNWVLVLVLA